VSRRVHRFFFYWNQRSLKQAVAMLIELSRIPCWCWFGTSLPAPLLAEFSSVGGWLVDSWRQSTPTHLSTDRLTYVRTRPTEIKHEWAHPCAQHPPVIVPEKSSAYPSFLLHISSPLKNCLCTFTERFWIIYCAFRNLSLIHCLNHVSGMRCCITDRGADQVLLNTEWLPSIPIGNAFRLIINTF
jgi:hypothetical protein